jgi:tripartite-type tricarboxylate transporter receptor subunit TctC
MPMRRLIRAFLALALATFAQLAAAQSYPTKPVRLIVPFAPGGGSDFIARLVAQKLGERLGQPVVVENRPGAGGTLGAELAVKSPPDGYTLLLCPASYTVNANLYKLAFDPVNDITPIVQLATGPCVVTVHPSVPANTLADLVALAKKDPDRLSFASPGNGSHGHVSTEYLLHTAGIKAVHVPYKGTGPALNDTIAGNVQFMLGSVATTLQHVKSGRLRGLAVTTAKRISAAPELPTVAEAGYPAYEVTNWHGILGPKGLPREIVERVNRGVNEVLKTDEVRKLLATDGLEPAGGTPEEFAVVLKSEVARWKRVVDQARVKID